MNAMDAIKLRALLAFQAIVQHGSLNKAAAALHLSQPTLTRSIKNLEQTLGVELFSRRAEGMEPSEFAHILLQRLQRSLDQLARLEAAIFDPARRENARRIPLHNRITLHQLELLILIERHNDIQSAADAAGITAAALLRAIRQLERQIGVDLFSHLGANPTLTPNGRLVLMHGKLARVELQSALEEIRHQQGEITGRLRIGAMPLSRTSLVPDAVLALLKEFPQAHVSIVDGNYDALIPKLRCGDVDVLIGALRCPPPFGDVHEERLFDDALAVLAGAHHPLCQRAAVKYAELMQYGWALPPESAPTRRIFNALLAGQGLTQPATIVEASSLISIRALLMQSEFLTILSPHQAAYEIRHGMLKVIEIAVPDSMRSIGISMRDDLQPTPILERYMEILREQSARHT